MTTIFLICFDFLGKAISVEGDQGNTVTYCDVKGGFPGTGNINADPLFGDVSEGDFHLQYPSPCRNAGDNTTPELPVEDFEGNPRIAYDDVDMGADEFYSPLYCTGEMTPGGSINGKIVGLPDASSVVLFLGSGIMDPPIPTAWGYFYLLPNWFLIFLLPIPSNGMIVLLTTLPPTPSAPYDVPMQALIGLDPDSFTDLYILKIR